MSEDNIEDQKEEHCSESKEQLKIKVKDDVHSYLPSELKE